MGNTIVGPGSSFDVDTLIIGGGPTGLGAAYRLEKIFCIPDRKLKKNDGNGNFLEFCIFKYARNLHIFISASSDSNS